MNRLTINDVTVLHVDDEPDFADLVAKFLENEDSTLSVVTSTSVSDALDVLHSEPIDCIVSDYDMPDTDGLSFLEAVRDDYPSLPFILFTGKGSEEIASQAISAGVTDYLQKDTGTDQYTVLANRILNAVRSSRAETAVERTEDRYHNLVDNAPIPILLLDPDWQIVYANDAAVRFLDADSFTEIEGKTGGEFVHPDDRESSKNRFQQIIEDNVPSPEKEYRLLTVDGEVKEATVATAPGYYRGEKVGQVTLYR